jgi:hypothetical protein
MTWRTRSIDRSQELQLALEPGGHGRLGQRVQIVWPPAGDGHHPGRVRLGGDGAGLARRLLQVAHRDVVGVGVAGPDTRLGSYSRPLADVAGSLPHHVLLEDQLLAHAILEVHVGIVHPADQSRADQAFHQARGEGKAIGEEALGVSAREVGHRSTPRGSVTEGQS